MRSGDQQLVAALTLLRDQLAPVVDELLAGELGDGDRRQLARALRTVAENLSPIRVVPGEVDSLFADRNGVCGNASSIVGDTPTEIEGC